MFRVDRPESIPEHRLPYTYVYEFSDIEYLENDLEMLYESCFDDNIFKRKNKPILLGDFLTFDIETTSIKEFTKYNPDENPIAFAYTYQFYIFGKVWLLRYDYECKKFFEIIANYCINHYCTICIYIHNSSFEYEFIKNMIKIDNQDIFAVKTRKLLRFTAYNGHIEFRCSYMLSNMSLEKFTENYCQELYRKDKELIDYEVIRWSWTELSNEIIYYCAMDVITLYHAVCSIMQLEGDTIKSIPMTNTGYVRRACRIATLGTNTKHYDNEADQETYKIFKRYRQMFVKTQLDLEKYNLMVSAYRGGNTHANRFYTGQILDNIGSVDFASSYPAVIVCSDDFPMGRLTECTRDCRASLKNFEWYVNRYFVVVQVVFKNLELRDPYHTPCPYIPSAKLIYDKHDVGIYDNGRVIKQTGYSSFSFLGIEWNIIKKQYKADGVQIVKAFYSVKGYLPNSLRKQCFEWFDKKTSLKNVSGFEYEYMKSKNRVNSIYGMSVEKIVKNIISWNDEKKGLEERKPTAEEAEKQLSDFYTPMQQKFMAYQWGVVVTAVARVRHMDLIDIAGDDFIYGDTDSVKMMNFEKHLPEIEKYNNTWKEYIKQCGVSYESYTKDNEYQCLGIADYEGMYDRFVTLGSKKYAYEIDGHLSITIAGVPKKIGAKLLKRIENFKPGFVFSVSDQEENDLRQAWKKKLTYRDDTDFYIEVDQDHRQHVSSGIAITRTTYELDLTDEYRSLTGYTDMYVEDDVY